MQLAAHEAHDLNELILSCVNTITNMSLFLNQVRDPELRAILERHFPMHVRDYNVKVEYARNAQGPSTVLPIPKLNYNVCTQMQQYTGSYPSATPRMDGNHFDDREIATAYLLTLKRAGREYAWSAFETMTPQLRSFLEDAFRMNSHHAYEVWQWMARRGYYPVENANNKLMQTMGQMYQVIPENQQWWDQSTQLYQQNQQNQPNQF